MAENIYSSGHPAGRGSSEQPLSDRLWDYLRGFSVIFSDIVLCGLAFMLVPLLTQWDMALALRLWIAAAALQLLAGNRMMERGVSWSVYLIIQGAFIAAGTAAVVLRSWFADYEADMRIFLAGCTVVTGLHSAYVSYRLPGANGIMRFVDLLIAAAAFYLYVAFQMQKPGDGQILTAVVFSLVMNLLVVNHLRTGGEDGRVIRGAGAGSRLALAGILAGCLLATGIIVGMASGQVHSAVDVLLLVLQGIYQVLSVIFGAVGRVLAFIILFLVAVFPMAPQAARENASAQVSQEMEELVEETGLKLPPWVLGAVLAVVLLALAGWTLYQLKGIRIRRVSKAAVRRRVVRKSHLLEAVTAIFRQIWERLAFEWEYLRHRNSPQGLLVLAERVGRKHHLARRPNESPGAYIRRFSGGMKAPDEIPVSAETMREEMKVSGHETKAPGNMQEMTGEELGASAMFSQLAEILDRIFYAGRTDVPETFDCRMCARQIRGCFRSL